MKWLNDYRMRLVLFGVIVAIVLIGGNAKADFVFGEPTNLGPRINSPFPDMIDCFSFDGLEMYITSDRYSGPAVDIWVAKRETVNHDWSNPVNLGYPINSSAEDAGGHLSVDGLEFYFQSERSGGYGGWDIWITKRATKDDAWGEPLNLGPLVNSSNWEGTPWLSSDELELYFYARYRAGGYGDCDIWVSRRATKDDPWGEPVNVGSIVNSSAVELCPALSPDGLLLFFSEDIIGPVRPGGFGGSDLWMTRRESISDPWGVPVNLGPIVNSSSHDCGPRVSPDGSTLYFSSERSGGYGGYYGDIYEAPIIPIVDFNGDGIVDSTDMCIMIDHWGTDNSLCDIGPMPWGDGIIDVEDLKVLAEHLFEEVDDPTLIAHWPLDEVQGDIAYDISAENDGTLIGDPLWQPDAGMMAGALQLDGIDDYVMTDSVLNPTDGKFSVIAWIKGEEPGQVVVSQQAMSNWLKTDANGNLVTELKCTGRSAGYLFSETVITDGQWHRIGLVWDGSHRMLFVDGVVVAEDTQQGLEGSQMGLYIGTGMAMETGTYFSGLIDDIRIYKRVVSP